MFFYFSLLFHCHFWHPLFTLCVLWCTPFCIGADNNILVCLLNGNTHTHTPIYLWARVNVDSDQIKSNQTDLHQYWRLWSLVLIRGSRFQEHVSCSLKICRTWQISPCLLLWNVYSSSSIWIHFKYAVHSSSMYLFDSFLGSTSWAWSVITTLN